MDRLEWEVLGSRNVLHTRVFDVIETQERSATGIEGNYLSLNTRDWVIAIAVTAGKMIMVRQWRHGSRSLTVEFPGGVADPGETPEQGAARELEEETGYRAGRVSVLGTFSPNPAIQSNRITFCLAEDLVQTGEQHLDRDEVLDCILVPVPEVLERLAQGEYINAFVGTGLSLYMRHLMKEKGVKLFDE